jgi:hypothetical protein
MSSGDVEEASNNQLQRSALSGLLLNWSVRHHHRREWTSLCSEAS